MRKKDVINVASIILLRHVLGKFKHLRSMSHEQSKPKLTCLFTLGVIRDVAGNLKIPEHDYKRCGKNEAYFSDLTTFVLFLVKSKLKKWGEEDGTMPSPPNATRPGIGPISYTC